MLIGVIGVTLYFTVFRTGNDGLGNDGLGNDGLGNDGSTVIPDNPRHPQ